MWRIISFSCPASKTHYLQICINQQTLSKRELAKQSFFSGSLSCFPLCQVSIICRQYCFHLGSDKQRYWPQAKLCQHSHLFGESISHSSLDSSRQSTAIMPTFLTLHSRKASSIEIKVKRSGFQRDKTNIRNWHYCYDNIFLPFSLFRSHAHGVCLSQPDIHFIHYIGTLCSRVGYIAPSLWLTSKWTHTLIIFWKTFSKIGCWLSLLKCKSLKTRKFPITRKSRNPQMHLKDISLQLSLCNFLQYLDNLPLIMNWSQKCINPEFPESCLKKQSKVLCRSINPFFCELSKNWNTLTFCKISSLSYL